MKIKYPVIFIIAFSLIGCERDSVDDKHGELVTVGENRFELISNWIPDEDTLSAVIPLDSGYFIMTVIRNENDTYRFRFSYNTHLLVGGHITGDGISEFKIFESGSLIYHGPIEINDLNPDRVSP